MLLSAVFDFGDRERIDSSVAAATFFWCSMAKNGTDKDLLEIAKALQHHNDWLAQMPWASSGSQSKSPPSDFVQARSLQFENRVEAVIRGWINEFGSEFQETSGPLCESISLVACCHRILNLLSGPCRAFLDGINSRSVAYQRIFQILQGASRNASPQDSIDHVRNTFRSFGQNDGVRHCVMASAVEAGHERAINVFRNEFDGVRRQLAASFSSRMDENAVDEIWQDVLTDLVWGGVTVE